MSGLGAQLGAAQNQIGALQQASAGLAGFGTQARGIQQAGLAEGYRDFIEEREFGANQVKQMIGALSGAPIRSYGEERTGYTTTPVAGPSMFGQVAGAFTAMNSDIRLKEDIQDEIIGLDFLNELRPVTFLWKKEKDIPSELKSHKKDSEKRVMNGKYNHGFIAQEVKATIDKYGLKEGFDMWQEDDSDGRQRIAPSAAVPLIIKAIQELSEENKDLKSRIEALESN